jgi:type VI protein secretion system component Hcp
MHNAEVYMLLVRPSMVPVLGESVTLPFLGQIELGFWRWNLHNEEERKKGAAQSSAWTQVEDELKTDQSADVRLKHAATDFGRDLDKILANKAGYDKDTQRRMATDLRKDYLRTQSSITGKALDKSRAEREEEREREQQEDERKAREQEVAEAERNRNFEFKFSKRVDIATTQMLNSMKAGDVFPSATITIIQRPVLKGTSLVLNFMKLRLLDYQLRVEVFDTMTHMYEEWTCEFHSMAYAYKNNSATHDGANVGQNVAQALSQGAGSVRAFAMRNLLPF